MTLAVSSGVQPPVTKQELTFSMVTEQSRPRQTRSPLVLLCRDNLKERGRAGTSGLILVVRLMKWLQILCLVVSRPNPEGESEV